jgi:hypothetical protein
VNLLIGSALVFLAVLLLIRQNLLQVKYGLIWLFASIVLIIWAALPRLVTIMTQLMGIAIASNAIFTVMILFCLMVMLLLSVSVSKDNVRIKKLAQEVALLRSRLGATDGTE